jgi:hypothetical protein
MDLPSPTLLLQIALCVYAVGAAGSLLALRHEKVANLFGFGCATVGGCFGIGAGVLGLISGRGDGRAAFAPAVADYGTGSPRRADEGRPVNQLRPAQTT